MIIRKPFAFIVQRFKLLHFIAVILCAYLGYTFWHIKGFFNDFVVNGYVTNITDASSKYYSFLMVLACLVLIVFTIVITMLFKKKNLFLPGLLRNAERSSLESSTSLILRGLSSIIFYSIPISAFVILLLAYGFDIKTGEFLDIKDEINLDEEDSEEVELNLKNEDYKAKRLIRRYFRGVKYYVIENKNIFIVLGGILGVIILFFVGRFIISLNRVVRVDQSFRYSNISLTFNESVLSTIDYGGNQLNDGKIYLAVKIKATNVSNDLVTITTDDFCLDMNNYCIYPKLDKSGKFIDLAKPYYGEKIGQGKTYEYVIVYELDESQTKSRYKIKILDSLVYKENELIPKYKEITLTPTFSNSSNNIGTYSLGEEIILNKTPLLNTKIKAESFEIVDNYRYTYDYCYKVKCEKVKPKEECENTLYADKCIASQNSIVAASGKTFITLKGSLELDENATYTKYKLNTNNFFSDFAKIMYEVNGIKYYANVADKTPENDTNNIVLEVPNAIKSASSLKLIITIRDKSYTLKLEKSQ